MQKLETYLFTGEVNKIPLSSNDDKRANNTERSNT